MRNTSPAQEFGANLLKSMEQMLSVGRSIEERDAMFQGMEQIGNT